jgi:hypothetical protein
MKVEDIHQYYGSAAAASKALNITAACFFVWYKRGYVPLSQQIRVEKLTGGELRASEEDAYETEQPSVMHFPYYRYYSNKYGMCPVYRIVFREGKAPKISYIVGLTKNKSGNIVKKTLVSFDNIYLMQAVDAVDTEGNYVFEGDLIRARGHKKNFIFKSTELLPELKELKGIKIVGNIYEGVKVEA